MVVNGFDLTVDRWLERSNLRTHKEVKTDRSLGCKVLQVVHELIDWEQENGIHGHMSGCHRQLESVAVGTVSSAKKQDPCRQRTRVLFQVGTESPKTWGFAAQDNGLHEK